MDNYSEFARRARDITAPDRVYTDELRRLAWGTDAGFYRHVPQVVVRSANENEVSRLLAAADELNLPVTFRAAGTSLSGQTVSDSIIIVAAKHWEGYSIAPDGLTITLQPGLTGARVDKLLAPVGRAFTPDPASKNSAMVGGIVMNNASGMSCGTHANSDKMLVSARLVLADGTVLDTGDAESRKSFRLSHPNIVKGVMDLRDRVLADSELTERIRRKYAIKNVTGLNLLPLVTFSDPFDIIAHLMVGSEGTLAFGSRFTMLTGPLHSHRASAMLYFNRMRTACEAVVALKPGPVHFAELLDSKSLASVGDTTGQSLTAVLVQTFADSQDELQANIRWIEDTLRPFELAVPARFTSDPKEYGKYWAIRSGIFPQVGGTRPLGTTVIIEDVAFHIDDLPQATEDLAQMLIDHGYDDACIYGHALEGNYHFIIAQSFDTPEQVARYRSLMEQIVKLVVDKYDGSLKAEHGTGRNMAPFVRHEWGDKAFEVMRDIKRLFDPKGLLNPGVIFNDDPECFIHDIKPMPLADDVVDRCIECGFCEVNCVTNGLTLSSRQRIIVQREMARLRLTGLDPELLAKLEKQYRYLGEQTCAADGLCSTSCPMGINVGELTHHLRALGRQPGTLAHSAGDFAARHFKGVKTALKGLLYVADAAHSLLGDRATAAVGRAMNAVGLPLWTPSLPGPCSPPPSPIPKDGEKGTATPKRVVYFPSCINQTMGPGRTKSEMPSKEWSAKRPRRFEDMPLSQAVVTLLQHAGWEVVFPKDMDKMCCGMIWESKGMPDIAVRMASQLEQALLEASDGGRWPVVCDQSPCLHHMRQHFKTVKPLELVEFIHDHVLDDLEITPVGEAVALHITCSTRLMGIADKVLDVARRCASEVIVPDGVGCCAFAGDKGFTHPEMNAYALRNLRAELERHAIRRGYSNSRTCEIGLTTHGGIPYQHLVYLVLEATSSPTPS